MSELQPDSVTFDDEVEQEEAVQETKQPEQPEAEEVDESEDQPEEDDSASATDDTAKKRAAKFDEKQQAVFDAAIGKQARKRREAEQRAEAAERKLAELSSKLPENTRPVIPPEPDPYTMPDQEYRAAIKQRDEAIRKQASYDARQEQAKSQAEQARQEADNATKEALDEKSRSYGRRALQLGITPTELEQAAATIAPMFAVNDPLVEIILEDEMGPLITKYLSRNLAEIEDLREMSPQRAAIKLATTIKQKASALKPKVNPAPDPVESPRQSGSTQRQFGPKGATYE